MSTPAKQVLIVEQNSSLKQYYTNALAKLGLDPKVVVNGQEALKFLKGSIDGTLALIVMDWNLPDVNGYLVAQKVRSDPRLAGVEFLITTSEVKPDDVMLMAELDVVHTLPKGASTQQIVDKVKAIQNEAGRAPRAVKLRRELEEALQRGVSQQALELVDREPELKRELSQARHAHLAGELEILRKNYDGTISLLSRYVDGLEGFEGGASGAGGAKGAPAPEGGANPLKCVNASAKALCHLGRFHEAEELYRKLYEKSPKNLAHVVGQADALLGQDKIDEARVKYAHVLSQDATNRDALIGLGKAAVVEGKVDEAGRYFGQVDGGVESPSFASFFNNRAIALIHAGDVRQAIQLYENALKFIKRDRYPVLFNLGMAWLRLHEAGKAADIFQQVLDTCRTDFVARKSILQKLRSEGRAKFIEAYGKGGAPKDA